jgi:hypothetical protein
VKRNALGRRPGGQRDDDLAAVLVATGGRGDRDGPAVHFGNPARQRQPETDTTMAARSARPFAPIEGREDPFAVGRGYSRTIVGDGEHDAIPLRADGQHVLIGHSTEDTLIGVRVISAASSRSASASIRAASTTTAPALARASAR